MILSIILNFVIFLGTFFSVGGYFHHDGAWDPTQGLGAFRYFTTLSNVLCAVSALLITVSALCGSIPGWVLILKYLGTAAVSVTLMTVLFFLGPTQGYPLMFAGSGIFVHLIDPLLAIFTFCFLECRTPLSWPVCLLGVLPTALYGALYLKQVVYRPEGEGWEDFYGFNRGGKWKISIAAMLVGTWILCIGLRFLTFLNI